MTNDRDEQLQLIKNYHENHLIGGHFGSNQANGKLKQDYYWPKLS